ncbi:MAG: RnfABCDGE type electron transport complex subunit G [Clostridia bacterium]|nr:RnfABCDGE type electron transport complex subunit G [Clostridia bacterium]MBQ3554568.1 RnfABCDGE type electron transport complex subunit G [Clostridia bacterium]
MQKNENPVVLAVILFLITASVALLLSYTNLLTKDKIAENTVLEQTKARAEVMTDAESFEKIELSTSENSIVKEIYVAKSASGETIGHCVSVAPNGFGGPMELTVGILSDDSLSGVAIVSHGETPGLGSKAQEPDFLNQFVNKSVKKPLSVIKSGTPNEEEIIAVSGATVTSTAVKDGINAARDAVEELKNIAANAAIE